MRPSRLAAHAQTTNGDFLNNMNLFHKAIAEFIGTFAIVFFGVGALMVSEKFPKIVSPFVIPIVFGLTIVVMIYASGHISGAHFNPVVTAALAITKQLPAKQVLIYWISQFLGGMTAISLLLLLFTINQTMGAAAK
jgi:glycerol uptake facilitator-like aquaporin